MVRRLAQEGRGGSRGPDASFASGADVPGGTPVLSVPAALILSSDQAIAELRGPGMADAERFVRERGGAVGVPAVVPDAEAPREDPARTDR